MTAPLDIFGLHPLPVPPAPHPWWPYVVVAAVAIAIAVVVLVRRRRRVVPADVTAMRALEATRELIARDDVQAFSAQVSTAVRDYVELAFGVRAPRRTTEELLADLMHDSSPVAPHREELGVFLEHCDLAKYARFALTRPQMTGMLDSAETFVRATAGGAP
ncbi:MAG: DUF4381 family protein [Deltaproteobacteria bacterium]